MLEISKLTKIYPKSLKGVKDVSFEVHPGEIVCIAGPNGSGKTTLIDSILVNINRDSGKVTLKGENLDSSDIRKKIAYISDDIILLEELSGFEYLCFIKNIYETSNNNEYLDILIDLFNLEENIYEPISSYSHGMKKKIQIISALMNPFDLLVLDEPCRGLDIESIYIIKRLLKNFRDGNKAIFISSHDLLFVEEICTRMLILSKGKLVDEGTVKELKNKYKSQNIEDVFLKAAMAEGRGDEIETLLRDIKNDSKGIY